MEQDNVNKVESYFRDELTPGEKEQFLKEMDENPELERLYSEYMLSMEAIDQQVETELRDQFNEWEGNVENEKSKVRFMPIIWKVAATLILLAVAYIVFYQVNIETTSGDKLALSEYQLPESPGSTMGDGNAQWSEGIRFFESNDFNGAVDSWSAIENPNPEMQYYLAHAYFNIGDYNEAANLFQALSEGNSVYGYSSDWYLLLTYMANNQQNDFNKQLARISDDPTHPYLEDALDLGEHEIEW